MSIVQQLNVFKNRFEQYNFCQKQVRCIIWSRKDNILFGVLNLIQSKFYVTSKREVM